MQSFAASTVDKSRWVPVSFIRLGSFRNRAAATTPLPAFAEGTKAYVEPKNPNPVPPKVGAGDGFQEDLQKALALQKQGKFAESLPFFQAAAKAKPNDKTAADGVKIAEFNVKMQDGNRLFDNRKYAEALREYEDALRMFPFSPVAKMARDKAKKAAEKK